MPKTTEAEAKAADALSNMLVRELEDSQMSVPLQMSVLTLATARQLIRVGLGGGKLLPALTMFMNQVVRHHDRENTSGD